MKSDSVVRARVDEQLKLQAAAIFEAAGLTLSDAIRMMLLRTVQEKAIPFIPAKPNAATIRALKNSQKGQGKRFSNLEDMFKHLNA